MLEETVHISRLRERIAFEVSVNSSEMLAVIKEITDTTKKLDALAYRLMQTLAVMEDDQSR